MLFSFFLFSELARVMAMINILIKGVYMMIKNSILFTICLLFIVPVISGAEQPKPNLKHLDDFTKLSRARMDYKRSRHNFAEEHASIDKYNQGVKDFAQKQNTTTDKK